MRNKLQAEAAAPLYSRVYNELASKLDSGEWKVGDRLPTEAALTKAYDCSLITIRRALDELVRDGRITRKSGKGTFVTVPPVDRELTALTSFTEEMLHLGLDPQTRVISTKITEADDRVAKALNLAVGAPVIYIERLRSAAGYPLLLEQVYLSAARFPGLIGENLDNKSLYDLLVTKFNVPLLGAKETLKPTMLSAREADILGQNRRQPAIEIHLVAFTHGNEPIEYCRTLVRGDRAKYHIEIGGFTDFGLQTSTPILKPQLRPTMQSSALPEDQFLSEICRQAEAVRASAAALGRQADALVEMFGAEARNRTLILTGMGSSIDVCWALESALGRRGILAVSVPSSELLHYRWQTIPQGANLITVTQSGRSVESVKLSELLQTARPDVTIISITNGLDNPVAKRATLALNTDVGPEIGPSTMTVAACLVMLLAIQRLLVDDEGAIAATIADAERSALDMDRLLVDPIATADRLAAWCHARPKMVTIGRGTAVAAAEVAALIMKESTGILCEAFEGADFRHGPLEIAGPSLAAVIVSIEPATRNLDIALANELLSTGSAVLFIGPEGAAPEGAEPIVISEVNPILDVAAALVPLHLLAWRLAHNAGRRPDRMVMASKVTTRE